MKKYLPTTSLAIFTLYIIGVMWFYGVLPSISDSYYHLPQGYKLIFSFALIGFALPLIIYTNKLLIFIAGGAIMFVAVTPDFHSEGAIHFICAIIGIVSGIFYLIVSKQYLISIIAFIIGIILYIFASNHIFWIEIVSFYTILLGIIIINKLKLTNE